MTKAGLSAILSFLIVTALILASCTTTLTPTSSTAVTPIQTTTSAAAQTQTTTITTQTTKQITTSSTPGTSGKWWDSLGVPQYGGELVLRCNTDINNFDTYVSTLNSIIYPAYMEPLVADDWTLAPSVFSYKFNFRPSQFQKGNLELGWEFTDATTYVVHLRQGIHWQNIAPASGREFIADDVVAHFQRQGGYGTYTLDPYSDATQNSDLISVTATDKYTVTFKWKSPNPEATMENVQRGTGSQCIENPEAVKLWGDLSDWHHAIGTGPFILTDFVSGASVTMVKNANYWAYDERYPQNKLPYIDKIKYLIIPNDATAMAAMRTGKIDLINQLPLQQAQSMQKSNPEMPQITILSGSAGTLDPRNDKVPFNDIRVRKAMQLAIDLSTLAKTYYGGTADPYPQSLTTSYMTGWGFPYSEWPADLKAEYGYDPAAAKKMLADAGYPNGFKTNVLASAEGDLDLLQVVKSYFIAVGIDMEIRPMDTTAWSAFVSGQKKHDQMVNRTGSGTLGMVNEPLKQLQRLRTGYGGNYPMVSDPVFDAFYPAAMAATSVDQVKKIVRDANEYVARQHFAISLVQPNFFTIIQPWFKGYNGQSLSISTGCGFAAFYLGRFWIDVNMKKSMGY